MNRMLDSQTFRKLAMEHSGKENDCKYMKYEEESDVYQSFSLKTEAGRVLYKSFTDEELLSMLKDVSLLLNHSPSQGEVFWALRSFIKERFRKWPHALELAGLAKGAGSGGKSFDEIEKDNLECEAVLEDLRALTEELGHIPHPRKYPKLSKRVKRFFGSWGEALRASGIDCEQIGKETLEKKEIVDAGIREKLDFVKNKAVELGRSPMHTEVDDKIKKPLLEEFGSWRSVLYQVDLEPVVRIHPFERYYVDHRKDMNRKKHSMNIRNCYYKLVEPSEKVIAYLEELSKLIDELGYVPDKTQVPAEMRKALIEECSSWANALYQIGIKQEQ